MNLQLQILPTFPSANKKRPLANRKVESVLVLDGGLVEAKGQGADMVGFDGILNDIGASNWLLVASAFSAIIVGGSSHCPGTLWHIKNMLRSEVTWTWFGVVSQGRSCGVIAVRRAFRKGLLWYGREGVG